MNLGLRYEAFVMPQPTQPNPALPQSARINSDTQMWQPRLGITWDFQGDGKTVLRLGGGLFYARTPLLLINQAFTANGNPSVGSSFNLSPAQIAAVQLVHPEFVFPFVPDTSKAENASYITGANVPGARPDVTFFEPDFRQPRSFQYTAALERQVSSDLAVAFDFVHNNSVYLQRIHDTNLLPPTYQLDLQAPGAATAVQHCQSP